MKAFDQALVILVATVLILLAVASTGYLQLISKPAVSAKIGGCK